MKRWDLEFGFQTPWKNLKTHLASLCSVMFAIEHLWRCKALFYIEGLKLSNSSPFWHTHFSHQKSLSRELTLSAEDRQKHFVRPGNQMGPRGTARNDKSLKSFISGAAPRNPLALPLETPWRCPSKPLRRPSKPHGAVPRNPRCAAPQNPWGQILRPKFSSFGGF